MKLTLTSGSSKTRTADLTVAGFFEDGLAARARGAAPEFRPWLEAAVRGKRFGGRPEEGVSARHGGRGEAESLALGLGPEKTFNLRTLQRTAGRIAREALLRKAARVRILVDTFAGGQLDRTEAAGILAQTLILASYRFDKYLSGAARKGFSIQSVELALAGRAGLDKAARRVRDEEKTAQGVLFARDLINEPGNVLTAPRMVTLARRLARENKMTCRVLGEKELRKLKMGGILAVNSGSVTPPALISLEHGSRFKKKGTICLVGKGVTFDTGGISIKPSKDMEKMKYDMSGSAAVFGAMKAISALKLPVHVVSLTPMVENNVAKDPIRPGDIIRMYSGKSVEVINTDAEGRLILADALAYAARFKPKAIIDLATLTGICAYTFADQCIAVMSNNSSLEEKVRKAGDRTGERCWPLPMWPEYGDLLKGTHSDLQNVGGPFGGTITAAKFLEAFVPAKTPWVHMDIAGTAWANAPRFDGPKGATGVAVRLLTDFAANWNAR